MKELVVLLGMVLVCIIVVISVTTVTGLAIMTWPLVWGIELTGTGIYIVGLATFVGLVIQIIVGVAK